MKQRQWRRVCRRRMVKRAQEIWPDDMPQLVADNMQPCSCHMCGNPRHFEKGAWKLTLQERRLWPLDQERELWLDELEGSEWDTEPEWMRDRPFSSRWDDYRDYDDYAFKPRDWRPYATSGEPCHTVPTVSFRKDNRYARLPLIYVLAMQDMAA